MMTKPLVVVDMERKGKVFLDYYKQQAEVITVLSPPVRCTYVEEEDEGVPRLRFSFSPVSTHAQIIDTLNGDQHREIILAFDNDIAGDYLGWLVQSYLRDQRGSLEKVKRLRVSRYSKAGIEKAFASSGSSEFVERQGFYIRSLFDSGLGAHLQRLIGSRVGPGNRPLTYASLTTLFLLADREKGTKMSPATKSWRIVAELESACGKLKVQLEKAPGVQQGGLIHDVATGKKLIASLQEQTFEVRKIEREKLVIEPPAPYVLAELLKDAQILYGYQPGTTAAILKNLAAGVETREGFQGVITSMSAAKEECAQLIPSLQKTSLRVFGEAGKGQKVHDLRAGMLLPLEPDYDKEVLEPFLDDDSLNIYELIRGRALASQMKEAIGEEITVRVSASGAVLGAQFTTITRQGFLSAHRGCFDQNMFEPCPFVELGEGRELQCVSVMPQQAVENLPEQFTYETLFAELADFSVAADSYTIMMLQGLIDHGYIIVGSDGSLEAGPNAGKVTTLLERAFPKMRGIHFSAYIEQTVSEVLTGRKGLDFALKQFGQTLMLQGKTVVKLRVPTKGTRPKRSSGAIIKQESKAVISKEKKRIEPKQTESAKESDDVLGQSAAENETFEPAAVPEPADTVSEEGASAAVVTQPEGETTDASGWNCSEAEQSNSQVEQEDHDEEQVLDDGSLREKEQDDENQVDEASEDFPDKQTANLPDANDSAEQTNGVLSFGGEVVETDQTKACPVCAKFMVLKKDQFGRFWTCSGFPSCRHSETYKDERGPVKTCPLCREREIVAKRTPTGKIFHVCLDPDCEFVAWSEPYHLPCQVCGTPYLVEKESAAGKRHLRCPKAGCSYRQALPGESADGLFDEILEKPAEPKRKKVRVVRRSSGASGGGKKKVRVVRRRK